MDAFYALMNCAAAGLVAGCLISAVPHLGSQVLPLAVLLASISAVLAVVLLTASPALEQQPVTLDLTRSRTRRS